MKIIFSRKGLDSSFGNFASPILPDGRLCWMPIPENNPKKPDLIRYCDVQFDKNLTLGSIIEELTNEKINGNQTIHLDPDLRFDHIPRKQDWRPLFGQTGASEKHLRNNKVNIGDIFLFFGWFKQTMIENGKLKYDKKAPDVHLLYGWMQIGSIYEVDGLFKPPKWAEDHPHMIGERYGKLDVLYSPTSNLIIQGQETNFQGYGTFDYVSPNIILTAKGKSRSNWELPTYFFPTEDKPPLSYHKSMDRWTINEDKLLLKIASRGQEFVLDLDYYPEVEEWMLKIINKSHTLSH